MLRFRDFEINEKGAYITILISFKRALFLEISGPLNDLTTKSRSENAYQIPSDHTFVNSDLSD